MVNDGTRKLKISLNFFSHMNPNSYSTKANQAYIRSRSNKGNRENGGLRA